MWTTTQHQLRHTCLENLKPLGFKRKQRSNSHGDGNAHLQHGIASGIWGRADLHTSEQFGDRRKVGLRSIVPTVGPSTLTSSMSAVRNSSTPQNPNLIVGTVAWRCGGAPTAASRCPHSSRLRHRALYRCFPPSPPPVLIRVGQRSSCREYEEEERSVSGSGRRGGGHTITPLRDRPHPRFSVEETATRAAVLPPNSATPQQHLGPVAGQSPDQLKDRIGTRTPSWAQWAELDKPHCWLKGHHSPRKFYN
jgi:hypothetical protein